MENLYFNSLAKCFIFRFHHLQIKFDSALLSPFTDRLWACLIVMILVFSSICVFITRLKRAALPLSMTFDILMNIFVSFFKQSINKRSGLNTYCTVPVSFWCTVCPKVEKTKMDNFLLFNIWGIYLVENNLNYH